MKSYSVTVGTASTIILPKLSFGSAPADWAAGAIAQGAYVTATNGNRYWTPNGGTASTEPTHTIGVATGGDGVKWVYIPSSRAEVVISIDDDADAVYVKKSGTAVAGETLKLRDTLPARNYYGYIGEISAIVESGTAVVTVEYE